MIKKITLTVAFSAALFVGGFAQKNPLKEADNAFANKEYFTAVDWYKKAYTKEKKKEKKAKILFQTAESYYRINDLNEAVTFYLKAIAANYPDPISHFRIGQAKKAQKLYNEAITEFEKYKKEVPSDARAESAIKSCELAQKWVDSPTRHKVDNMPFNSKEEDFSPAFSDKKNTSLYFTSTRDGSTGGKIDGTTGSLSSDIYETKLGKDGKWSTPTPLGPPINTPSNEGQAVVSRKGDFMIFTRCGQVKNKNITCQLFIAKKQGPAWAEPELLPFNVDSSYFEHPALSPDGNTLYFSSNMAGGKGKNDIWISTFDKKGKAWGAPVNAGAAVNTSENEGYPYLHPDGKTLYFASTGLLGMGGLDIYKITADKSGSFSGQPENLKYPLNSPDDDFGIIFDGNKDRGYLSSNREGGKGKDDIWSFYLPPLVFNVSGIVTNSLDKTPVPNCPIIIKGSDGTLAQSAADKDGNYTIKLSPGVSYEIYTQTNKDLKTASAPLSFLASDDRGKFTTVDVNESTNFKKDFQLVPVQAEIKFPAVLYALGKSELLIDPTGSAKGNDTHKPLNSQDSLNYLYKTLMDNPTIVVELSAHTDSRGSDKLNDPLSQARAQTCVDYLISKGIPKERMVAKGWGKHKLKISDAQIAKAKTKEEKEALHAINRRTVFRILNWDYVDPKAPKTEIPKYHPKVSGEEDSSQIEDAPADK
ncbi:MAG: PD40 domain-containing protein [Bacteroidetes bacterium]|nr:PD40 domain-containing protein [Bacteroidota bacterium]